MNALYEKLTYIYEPYLYKSNSLNQLAMICFLSLDDNVELCGYLLDRKMEITTIFMDSFSKIKNYIILNFC